MDIKQVEVMDNLNNNSMFTKKVSVWHIIYLILICVIINVFLFAICPGKVSDAAMDNISFASAIVSIVLALVSIVYSLQSGFSSSSQLEGIKSIENNIQKELNSFKDLRDTIAQQIDPIKKTAGELQKTAGDLQRAQDNIKRNIDDLNKPITLKVADGRDASKKKDITLTHTMVVTLYSAAMSEKTGMDVPFHVFANYMGYKSHYAEGMLEALAALDDGISIEVGSSSTRKKITSFNNLMFGSLEELREKAVSNANKRIGEDFITAIDEYYSNIKNQQAKDSIGFPAVLHVHDSMEQVMRTFDDTNAWNLPVVDENGKYVGFVSKSKIFNSYRKVLVHFSDE